MLKSGLNNSWATPIYKTSITQDECTSLLNEIMKTENIVKPQSDFSDGSLTDRIPLLKTLADIKYAEFFKEALEMDLNDFEYDFKSWLTGSTNGYNMDIHNHSGAQFAAVFYLLAEEQDQGGELVIHDPRVNANRGYDSNKFKHFFSPIEHTPSTGDVLIMPGYVYHSVRPYHSSLRIAVPVDIFIKDN
jgi:hypothetical protein